MIHLTYLEFIGTLALAVLTGAATTLLLAALTGRMGDTHGSDDTSYLS